MARFDQDPVTQSRRIGRYEVLGEIASGGMATVYLARSVGAKGFSRLVAIKRLHPHLESEEDFVQMFLDEARLAARIRHPNVVATLDVEDSEGLYIVMEYIEGVTLLTLTRAAQKLDERLPVPVACRIALDTLSGLQAAHELLDDNGDLLGLVHRDVSPQNILLGIDGAARLTDFGIAKATSRFTMTRDGQLKGKISYMAPEQTKRQEIDRRVDLFTMGIVFWELLAGRRLFHGDSDVEVLNHLLFEPIPRLKDHAPSLPASLEQVVMKALERDPNQRYNTAQEFGEAIERSARVLGGPVNHRIVASFVQKVCGERITRDRGRIANGLPPADPNSSGNFNAVELGDDGIPRMRFSRPSTPMPQPGSLGAPPRAPPSAMPTPQERSGPRAAFSPRAPTPGEGTPARGSGVRIPLPERASPVMSSPRAGVPVAAPPPPPPRSAPPMPLRSKRRTEMGHNAPSGPSSIAGAPATLTFENEFDEDMPTMQASSAQATPMRGPVNPVVAPPAPPAPMPPDDIEMPAEATMFESAPVDAMVAALRGPPLAAPPPPRDPTPRAVQVPRDPTPRAVQVPRDPTPHALPVPPFTAPEPEGDFVRTVALDVSPAAAPSQPMPPSASRVRAATVPAMRLPDAQFPPRDPTPRAMPVAAQPPPQAPMMMGAGPLPPPPMMGAGPLPPPPVMGAGPLPPPPVMGAGPMHWQTPTPIPGAEIAPHGATTHTMNAIQAPRRRAWIAWGALGVALFSGIAVAGVWAARRDASPPVAPPTVRVPVRRATVHADAGAVAHAAVDAGAARVVAATADAGATPLTPTADAGAAPLTPTADAGATPLAPVTPDDRHGRRHHGDDTDTHHHHHNGGHHHHHGTGSAHDAPAGEVVPPF